MQTFTGTEYLKIDIANTYGFDRLTWDKRIAWFDNEEPHLESLDVLAKHPILYRKAVRAMRTVQQGKPTNHIMGLDATASGLQIMAALSGCYKTAQAVNLVDTGTRQDVYMHVTNEMNTLPNVNVVREIVKPTVMTTFYSSTAIPKKAFGIGTVLATYYEVLERELTGAFGLMKLMQCHWNPGAIWHRWTLPDKHISMVPVTDMAEKSLEIDECDHMRFTYRTQVQMPKKTSRSLVANITHSIDGWIVRQMVLGAKAQGFWMAPVHDCFYASPNNMNKVRHNYIEIMKWIANQNLVQDILTEIAGRPVYYYKHSHNLASYIDKSNYMLS